MWENSVALCSMFLCIVFSSGRGQSVKAGIAANLLNNPSLLSMKGNRKGQSPIIQTATDNNKRQQKFAGGSFVFWFL